MKKFISVIIIFAIILSIASFVNAENSLDNIYSVKMDLSSESKLEAGKEVDVKLSIAEINAGEGISTITGYIEYDKNIFENITDDNYEEIINGENNWRTKIFNQDNNKFAISYKNRNVKINTSMQVATIKLKVKDTATITAQTTTTIKIKDFEVAGGEGNIHPSDVKITIGINGVVPDSDLTPTPSITPTVTPTVTPSTTPTVTPTQQVTTVTPTSSSSSNGKLPQTGENTGIIAGGLIFAAIASSVIFIKYRGIDK